MDIKLFINQDTQGNTYIVIQNNECYIIDPGSFNMKPLLDYIKEEKITIKGILITHGHYDHVIGITEIISYQQTPVYIGEKDYDFLYDSTLSLSLWHDCDFILDKNVEVIKVKENDIVGSFQIINTPGHTQGGVCYFDSVEKILFSGDTLFKTSYGRTDLPTGNMKDLKQSINKLLSLNEDVIIYPGHGGATTVKKERENSRF